MSRQIRLLSVDLAGRDSQPCFICQASPTRKGLMKGQRYHNAGIFEASTEPDAAEARSMFENAGIQVSARSGGRHIEHNTRGIGVSVCEKHKKELDALREAIRSNAMCISGAIIAQVVSSGRK